MITLQPEDTSLSIETAMEVFVEGYLFGDLATMARAPEMKAGKYGACGYSMVLVCLTGIELLGALTYRGDDRVSTKDGWRYFDYFWTDFLYAGDAPRSRLAQTVRSVVRDGLAHVFLPKPGVLISTQPDGTNNHLTRNVAGSLLIDAHVLAQDLQKTYAERVKPLLLQPATRDMMQSRLDEMRRLATVDSFSQRRQEPISSLPEADELEGYLIVPSGQVMARPVTINSPTVAPSSAIRPRFDQD